ncbi:GHKL domain-containing protein [Lacihabitans sp. CCS-44]|uniref:ATP-binding protein n=1 Tax=Lacihabitans sp. CCS-44 TaxID=2487331 RepID=UPI0020CFAFE5|nr:ATP-binding protein [Lacihabitans sp. CCS-44]MCP9753988.1 GHKL domain-containing protein [Lacihabitans sp. CCS-44]
MLNFFVAFFALRFIRTHLNTQESLPQYDQYLKVLNLFIVPFLLLLNFTSFERFLPTINFCWFMVFSATIYVLWLLRENNLASSLLKAGLPFYVVNSVKDFLEYYWADFLKENDVVADFVFLGALFWMIAFAISTNNQIKALKKEEEKNRIVVGENEKLEILVKERTSEILAQKEQLESTVEELKATQNQLVQQEKLASLGELTAGIAHEIQNPLNFVNNFSELNIELIEELMSSQIPRGGEEEAELLEDIKQNLEKINHHGKRAASIVKGMLQHSRTNTGQKEPTDINALADEFLRLSYHGLRAKDKTFNADFKAELDSNLPLIDAVPQDMGRVFLNLINNAFYACNERSKNSTGEVYKPLVTVSTKTISGAVEIRVKDNGSGISSENMERIFQPFFTTKPTGKGTGLGLSLAYDIVTKGHGGTVECESVEGVGTEFSVKLPMITIKK